MSHVADNGDICLTCAATQAQLIESDAKDSIQSQAGSTEREITQQSPDFIFNSCPDSEGTQNPNILHSAPVSSTANDNDAANPMSN